MPARRLLVFLCALLVGAPALLAQRTTATLFGNVQDPSGAAVLNAKVTVTNEATNAKYSSESDERGDFSFAFLPVGKYRLEVQAAGLAAFSDTGVTLDAGQSLRYPLTLKMGQAADSVTVTAEAPLVENATAGLMDRVSRLQLEQVPHGRRNFTALLALENGYRPSRDGLIQFNGLAPAV